MKIIFILFFIAIGALASNNKLTIDKALSIAIKNSPKIKAIQKDIISKELSGKSDSSYPNPELEIELGDFLGTGNTSGFKNSSLSLNLSQEIVLGGKNSKLLNLTDTEIKLIKLEIKKEKINLKYQIKKLFTQILILKEFQKLSLESQKISSEILQTVKNKQESGDLSYLEILKSKKNRRLLILKDVELPTYTFRTALNGVLSQEKDFKVEVEEHLETITKVSPSESEVKDLLFANKLVKHTKSNTIVLAKDGKLIASGTGQTSRVDALRQAIVKANSFGFDLKGAVMASDAFFPFPDCVEIADEAGITAVIQPGGSINDKLSIEYCDKHNMSMVRTGTRHFKH